MRFTMLYRPRRVASGAGGTAAGTCAATARRGYQEYAGATAPGPGPAVVRKFRPELLQPGRCRPAPGLTAGLARIAACLRQPVARRLGRAVRNPVYHRIVRIPAGCLAGPAAGFPAHPDCLDRPGCPDCPGRTVNLRPAAGCSPTAGHRNRLVAGLALAAVAGRAAAEPGPG